MFDRPAYKELLDHLELFKQFLDYLESEEAPPEFIGDLTPNLVSADSEGFDPYQMVAEWTALRHEVKQQGKLLHTAQASLQQGLDSALAEKEQLQEQLKGQQHQAIAQQESQLAAQEQKAQQQQKKLLQSLLEVADALDHACAHWHDELATVSATPPEPPPSVPSLTFWQWLQQWWARLTGQSIPMLSPPRATVLDWSEILTSNQQGLELIRRQLLEVLQQQQVTPMEAQGKPFDPQCMHAIGRQELDTAVEDNRVYQEVVRGYLWGDQILREAQVIVAFTQKDLE